MIFFTCRALSSAARPVSALPALLLTMIRSLEPFAISASMSSEGMPAVPNPPIITVAPLGISATATAAVATTLLIIPSSQCAFVPASAMPLPRSVIVLCDYRTSVRSTNTVSEGEYGVKGDYR